MVKCPLRIQKFFFQLQKYDFELKYAPGKTMLVSDTFSRSLNVTLTKKLWFDMYILSFRIYPLVSTN